MKQLQKRIMKDLLLMKKNMNGQKLRLVLSVKNL